MTTAGPVDLADLPPGGQEPVFAEPWQAQVFAIVLSLHRKGLFSWTEWAAALAEQIDKAQAQGDADRGDTYYHHWLATLEYLLSRKQLASAQELQRFRHAWGHAASRTRHGQPISLQAADFHD